MEIALEVRNLNISYKNKPVIIDINFKLFKNQCFALLGESGSGKTLTALSLFDVLPNNFKIESGEIFPKEKNKMIYLFQDPLSALNPVFKLKTQIKSVQKAKKSFDYNEMINTLKSLAFPEPEKKIELYPHQLSGGMQQRFALALSLLKKSEILIADEPTTALDLTVQAKILNLFEKLKKEKLSILMITHDMGVVAQIADWVGVMYLGRLLEISPVEEFFDEPLHPYSKILQEAKEFKIKKIKEDKTLSFFEKPLGCPFHPKCEFKMDICEKTFPQIFEKNKRKVWCHLFK